MSFAVNGFMELVSWTLHVRFNLSGAVELLDIPASDETAARRDRIWEGTCFELFLGDKPMAGYWEINLSPAGHWNVYRFQDYRLGMVREERIGSLPFGVSSTAHALHVNLEVDLRPLCPPSRALDMGISCVLKDRSGKMSYWALTHCAEKPDFHCRQSFLLSLP